MMGETNYFAKWYLPTVPFHQQWIAAVKALEHFGEFAKANKLKSLELDWTYPHGNFDELSRFGAIRKVIERLSQDYSASHHGPMASMASDDPVLRRAHAAEVLRCIMFGQAIDSDMLHVVHLIDSEYRPPWKRFQGDDPVYDAARMTKAGIASALDLKNQLEIAVEMGMPGFKEGKFKIGLETLSAGMPAFHHPNEFKTLLDDNFGLVLDLCHLDGNEIPVWETIEQSWEHIFEIHLTANDRGYDDHCGLNDCTIKILGQLRDRGFKGRIIAEIKPKFIAPSIALLRREGFM